jgi:adenosine deaminase
METDSLNAFIAGIPKAELHLHIEGTLGPELLFQIAERNRILLKYRSVNELRNAYDFNNLQEFLDIYYEGANVLINEQDFYDLTMAYLTKAHEQHVVHTEIFFDPQTHLQRGIEFGTMINGIQQALTEAHEELNVSTRLIPCFLRHLDEEDAIKTFREALKYGEYFTAFGLDSSEVGHPPGEFKRVFEMVREEGFLTVAHAGEEGPSENVSDTLRYLNVSRIDHGIRSIDDDLLLQDLAYKKIPLTVCPLSNLKLKVVRELKDLPLKTFLQKNIVATINSDDPAYFGGYINENYMAAAQALNLTEKDIVQLAENSFTASFLDFETKQTWFKNLKRYSKNHE